VRHLRRGIYRLVHFPAGEHEDLVTTWLWSNGEGVFSHETALLLHGLSDVLPSRSHMTLPMTWVKRRLRVPEPVSLHFSDVTAKDRSWADVVPVTTITRTLNDCARDQISPELLAEALHDALTRGLTVKEEVAEVERYLSPFARATL
jgi:predicted transcriptional regulator of viral defense system